MQNGKTSCFVDTNLLVYAVDPAEPSKRKFGADLLSRIISDHILVLSPQSLNECYHVLAIRRRVATTDEVRSFVSSLSRFCTAPYDFDVTRQAWQIRDRHRFGWWDCMLLASASMARCDVFFSEDMQHDRDVDGLTILNPFRLDPDFSNLQVK